MHLTSWLSALKTFGFTKRPVRRSSKQNFAASARGSELLEDRALLSTFHVALTGDNGNDGSAAAPFRTVQAAINAAAAADDGDDVIKVAAGTYNTFDVDGKINVLNSANTTNLVISGGWDAGFVTATPRSTIYMPDYTGAPTNGSLGDIDVLDPNTTITGFHFVFDGNIGGTGGTRASGGLILQSTGITIEDNTIEIGGFPNSGVRSSAIQTASSDTSNLLISNNTITSDGASLSNGLFFGPGVGTNTQVIGNTITGTSFATIITINQRGDISIADNLIQRSIGNVTTFQAITVRGGASATPITGISITGNTIDGGGTGTGIHISSIGGAVQPITGFEILNNVLSNHAGSAAIVIGSGATQTNDISGTIAYNSITGNLTGIATTPAGTGSNDIDASRNWWGDISGPTTATNPGGLGQSITDAAGISFAPWLIYSPDTNPALTGVQLPTTVTVTPGGDVSAADNAFTRLQNAIGAAAAGQTIDIQGLYDWTATNASAAYLASTGTSATADIRGVEIPANIANLTITSSDTSAHVIGLGDVVDGIYDTFVFTDDGVNSGNTNLTISQLNIDDFESAVMMGWNVTGVFNGTQILNNTVTVGGDNEATQNIAFYLSLGANQLVSGNNVTFQADGALGAGARSFGFQNSTTGGTGYNGLVISDNVFAVGATSNGVETITGIWENGHNDNDVSQITIANNQFLGRQGIDDFDRGLMLTSQTTGLLVDGNQFTDVDNVYFARNASGGTDPGDEFTFTNNVLTRVGGADGIFLQNVTTDPVPTTVVINWNINNTVDGFTGVRGLNELSVDATGASRPLTGAADLDAVNAIGLRDNVFVDDDSTGAARFTDPDGIGSGAGPSATGFNSFATITEGIDAVEVGGTVNVAAGTYAENLAVNKSLSLVGPNAGIDPNTGTRVAEAFILPAVTETSLQGSTSGVIVRVGSPLGHVDVSIDGFTIDGHNASLTGGRTLNGVEIHTGAGIANSIGSFDANPGGYDTTLDIQNNVIQNLERYGVLLDNVAARTATAGNDVSHNKIDNLPSGNNFGGERGRGAAFEENVYGTFSYNVVTRVNVGWQNDNYDQASPGAGTLIDNNTISTYHRGIFHNLQYSNATAATISNNTISAETAGDFPASATNFGIEVSSLQGTVGVNVIDNDVTGTVYGVLLWNNPTTGSIAVSGGTLTGNQYGIFATSNDDQFGGASGASQATISDVTIVNPTLAGIAIDNSANIAPVALTIGSGNSVAGGPVGLLVDGPNTEIIGDTLNDLAFAGQSGNYITLADGALDDEVIDATNATFEGLLPSALSVAQLFDLENKIFHEVDDATLGLIETTPGVFYVTPADSPTATDNDYTRLANIMALISSGDTVNLSGTFDWTEANAAASWALGNDGVAGGGDDYSLLAPAGLNDVTWTSAALGTARIQGPGDLAGANLEGVFYFDGGDNQGWTISNLEIFDFDLSIGFFLGAGGVDAFNDTTITNNSIRVPADLNTTAAPIDVNQNIGIHFSFGTNQTISNNLIEIIGSGLSDGVNFSSSVGMQSNTSGGAVYDGLLIDNNTINVTGTLAAQPSTVLGIWENSAGHSSDIVVSNNDFVNLTGANAATNLMRAFRITSHSSATTTVTYSDNTVTGASIGFQWLAGGNFTGLLPVELTNNTVTDTQTGILIQSNGLANLTGNTLDGIGGTSIGLQVVAGSTATLYRNNISGANIGVDNSGTLTSVTENFIRNNTGDGLRVNVGGSLTGPIFNNDLSGNTGFSINSLDAAFIDASGNYFGETLPGDVAGEVVGDIDYTPWLLLGVDSDLGTEGFQGDFSALGVDDDNAQAGGGGYIQEAVDLLADGQSTGSDRTIELAAGTYAETADLNVPLTLIVGGDASVDSLDSIVDATIDLQANTLTVGNAGADNTLAGPIEGAGGSLVKQGSGILTLSGTSTYTGTTDVDAGTLLVTGSTTSDTTVANLATLSGDGTIDGSVTVSAGGTLTPGDAVGILNTGDLTLAAGSDFEAEVNGATVAGLADGVVVSGAVDITGANLITSGTVTTLAGQVVTLIDNDGVDPVVGTFALLPEGATVNINGTDFTISYIGGTGNDVTLTEAPVIVTINDVTVDEAAGTLTFDVTLSRTFDIDITIDVTFTDVTATGGGVDYVSTTQQVTILEGQTSGQVVVPISEDLILEGDETFTAALSTATVLGGRVVDLTDTGTGTITDNDVATVSITAATDGAEGTPVTDGVVTVTLSAVSSTDTVVNYSVGGTATSGAGNDYTELTGTVTIPAGQLSADIDISVLDDAILEGTETVVITLTGLGAGDPDITLSPTPADLTATVNITDDDTNTLTISSPTVSEGDAGTTTLTFVVTSPNAVAGGFTVDFVVTNVSTDGSDYTVVTTSPVTFTGTAGETQTITVNVIGDTIVESDETFTVTLGTVTPVAPVQASSFVTGAVGTGTITDDDTNTLTISSPTVTEGNAGVTILTFTVTSPNAVAGGFTVDFDVTDLSTDGSDYTVITISPLTFVGTAGETQTITVEVAGDTIVEGDESFTMTLGTVTPVAPVEADSIVSGAIGTGTITNDDTSTLTISSPTIVEGDAGTTTLTFTVTSPNAVQGGFTVDFTVADVTASGTDYTVVTSSPLTFTGVAGETQTITVNVIGDTLVEADETFTVTLGTVTPVSPVVAASVVTGAVGTGTITNDDAAVVSIAATTDGVEAGTPTNGQFTVTQSAVSATDTVVTYTITGTATAGSDYTTLTGTVTIPAGQLSAVIDVTVLNDAIVEATETVIVTLTGFTSGDPSITLDPTPANQTATVEITDTDTATFTITNVTVNEADGTLVFDVVTDNALDIDVTIDVSFTDVTATGGGTDYASVTQSITFLAGETSKQVSVAITDDNVVEATETFTATLSTATPLDGRVVDVTDTGTGTITDNDTATFTIGDVFVSEADGTLVLTVSTDKALDTDVTVTVTFTDVTATGSGTDYTSATQQITFLAGETSKQVSVAITDDNLVEGTETFTATLSSTTVLGGRTVDLTDTATGTITDNDVATVSIAAVTNGVEAGTPTNGLFTVTLSTPSATDTVVNYTVTGTATGGTDYATLSGSVTIPAGQTTANIDVTVLDDLVVEGTESVIVTLTGVGTGDSEITLDPIPASLTATVLITDNDTNVLTISSPTVTEGNAGTTTLTFTVTSPTAVAGGFTVAFNVADISTNGADYTILTSSPLTFTGTAGETQTVTINVVGDTIVEGDETLSVTLGQVTTVVPGAEASITTGAVGTGTILNDDTAVVSITKISDGAESGTPTNGRFRIVLSTVSSTDTIVTYSIGGTATPGAGQDYATLTGTVTIPAGQLSVDIDVTVFDDNLVESTETVIVTLAGFTSTDPSVVLDSNAANLTTTVNITDDDEVNIISPATATVVENTPASTVVLDVDTDPVPGQTVTYSLSGPDAAQFTIDAATGEIRFVASPNFEAAFDQNGDNVYNVTVTATADVDPASSTSQDVTITVTGINDLDPIFGNASPTFSLPENSAAGTVVGTVSATDADQPAQTLTYSIVSGNETGAFAINPATGEITVVDPGQLNFEGPVDSFSLLVRVTDNGSPTPRTADAMVVINVTNVVEGLTITIPDGPGSYQLKTPPVLVAPNGTVTFDDLSSPDFSNAKLTVSVSSGRDRRDRIAIIKKGDPSGQITVRGRKILSSGEQIGTVKGGRGNRNPNLVVTFNGNADQASVENVIQRISFQAKSGSGTTRTISLQLTGVSGSDSNIATREISVS